MEVQVLATENIVVFALPVHPVGSLMSLLFMALGTEM